MKNEGLTNPANSSFFILHSSFLIKRSASPSAAPWFSQNLTYFHRPKFCSPLPSSSRFRLSRRWAALPWRRAGVLAGISLGLALLLIGFLFDWSDHFFVRLLTAFFVLFWLLAVTFLGVVPFVTWATGHWFGRGWQPAGSPAAVRRPAPSSPAPPGTSVRRPTHRS